MEYASVRTESGGAGPGVGDGDDTARERRQHGRAVREIVAPSFGEPVNAQLRVHERLTVYTATHGRRRLLYEVDASCTSHLADAVLHEPGEGEPIVSEVLRSGYTWNGKVLRPAMVKVRG